MKRLSARGKPDRELADVAVDLSVRPKYAPIPEFGVVVLESRHAPEWSAPGWFDEDFNKFILLVSGAVRLQTRTQQYHLGLRSFCHLPAHTPHFFEDRPGDPVVLYVIHYRPQVLPDCLGAALASVPVLHWNLSRSAMPIAQPIRSAFQEMLFEQATRRVGWEAMLTSSLLRLAVRAVRFGSRHVAGQELAAAGASQSAEPVVAYLARLESGFFRQETDAGDGGAEYRAEPPTIHADLPATDWGHVARTRPDPAPEARPQAPAGDQHLRPRDLLRMRFRDSLELPPGVHRGRWLRAVGLP